MQIVRENYCSCRGDHRVLAQHRAGKKPRLAQQEIDRLNSTTAKILKLELKKVRYLRSLSFIQGTCVKPAAHFDPFPDALLDLYATH